jgi:Zn-dependent protease
VNNFILQLALAVIPAVLAITLHEAAHGYAALALGDDTARLAGRLSLNPLRHIDPVGTVLLPGILLIGQLMTIGHVAFMFGWAKPVPVAAWKFRDPRRGMMLVAMAGPAMNFFLAWLGALSLHLLCWYVGVGSQCNSWLLTVLESGSDVAINTADVLAKGVVNFIIFNLVLGLFNLLPIPPLDGGRIVVGLLPKPIAIRWAQLERVGILIVLLLIFIVPQVLREFGTRFDPVNAFLSGVVLRAIRLTFHLAGVDDVT